MVVENPFGWEDPALFFLPRIGGHRLAATAYFCAPQSTEWAVAIHGTWSNRNCRLFKTIGLNAKMNLLAFDHWGHGNSEGDRQAWSCGHYETDIEELRMVIEWIRSKGQEVTMLIGHSRGAAVVNLYTQEFDDVPYIVSISGRCQFAEYSIPYWVTKEQLEGLLSGSLEQVGTIQKAPDGIPRVIRPADIKSVRKNDLSRLSTIKNVRHYFILHGSADPTVPSDQAPALDALINPSIQRTLKLIEDGDHYLRSPRGAETIFGQVIDFFNNKIWPVVVPSSTIVQSMPIAV